MKERLSIKLWFRAYTRARVRGPAARGGLPPRHRSKFLQTLNSRSPGQRHDPAETTRVRGLSGVSRIQFRKRPQKQDQRASTEDALRAMAGQPEVSASSDQGGQTRRNRAAGFRGASGKKKGLAG